MSCEIRAAMKEASSATVLKFQTSTALPSTAEVEQDTVAWADGSRARGIIYCILTSSGEDLWLSINSNHFASKQSRIPQRRLRVHLPTS
jgi:hypothetical protein